MRLPTLVAAFALTVLGFGMQGCNKDSDAENAVEDVTDSVGDAASDAGDEINDAAKDVTE